MIVSSVVCCLCRRKANSGSFGSNSFMRIFGYQLNTSPFFQRSTTNLNNNNNNNNNQQPTEHQSPIRLNMTHINRNKPTTSSNSHQQSPTSQISTTHNRPPPSYEEGIVFLVKL
jgi:hypothetical protein